MHRPRLRSQAGCLRCKRRRKKCDEGKPRCAACVRAKSTCEWVTKTALTTEPSSSTAGSVSSTTSSATIETPTEQTIRDQRVADHVGLDQLEYEATYNTTPIEPTQFVPPTEPISAENASILHVLITGIFHGWDQVPQELRAEDLWSKAIARDCAMRYAGHGMAARLAISLLTMLLMQVCRFNFMISKLISSSSTSQLLIRKPRTTSSSYLYGIDQSTKRIHTYSFEIS